MLAEQVGIALQVVLEALPAAERLAFVLHDMFAVPFDEIASMLERSPTGGPPASEPRPAPGANRGPVAPTRTWHASAGPSTRSSKPRATAT